MQTGRDIQNYQMTTTAENYFNLFRISLNPFLLPNLTKTKLYSYLELLQK